MAGLQLVVTAAGRAAMVNPDNTGTRAVTIDRIGVTGTAFTANPDGSDAVLPGELKRIATFGGAVVADDTIHVTLRDDSEDAYPLRGFALYLADGTLFALYGQAGIILEKSTQAGLLLSTDIRFTRVDASLIVFGDTVFINPPATTEVQGVVELATNQEALTGTDGIRAVTGAALKFVLDSRFGAGAPSAFMKGVLNVATAALLRAAIGIKSAALKDEGAGNQLDADMVDGKHASDFAATGHAHSVGSITGLQEALDARALKSHTHNADDINTGVLAVARIPDLALSKVTSLVDNLNAKAATSGGTMSGQWKFIRNNPAPGGNSYNDGHIELQTTDQSFPRIGFHRGGVDAVALTYMGGNIMALWFSGGERRDLFHTGNFDPNAKANLSGANFTGQITAPSINATSSDRRLKRNIRDFKGCLAIVKKLRPRRYVMRATGADDFGYVAQELAEVLPGSVYKDEKGRLYVRYGKAEPILAGAISELDAKVQSQVESLSQRIARLEKRGQR